MVPAWMLYATAIGVLACGAALAAEHLLGVWGLPRRFVWVAAMALTIALPIILATRSPRRIARTAMAAAIRRTPTPPRAALAVARSPQSLRITIYRLSIRFDRVARTLWIVASLLVSAGLIVAVLSLYQHRDGWRGGKLYGHDVMLTRDLGPAVVGVFRPRIVIPEWALGLPDRERRFMLHHELEHLMSNDPQLLLFTGIALLLCPWNAALWWMAHRLRLAIEIDCDARVIAASDAPDEYGLFLVAVGERRTSGFFLAASLAERQSSLERRIVAMTSLRPRRPLLASLPFAAIVIGAATLAAQTPQPPAVAAAGGMIRMSKDTLNRIKLSDDQVRALIASHHPDVLRGVSEDNSLTIVLASNGDLVVSGTSKVALGAVARVSLAPTSAGGAYAEAAPARATAAFMDSAVVAAKLAAAGQGGGVSAMPARTGDGAGAEMGAVKAALVASQGGMMTLAGVGSVDASLVQDMYFTNYDAGVVSVNPLHVRFVILRGNSMK